MSQNIPVSNLPAASNIRGLTVAWASTTTLTVGTGQARDSNNVIDMTVSSTLTVNGAVNGANGLDSGALANSTWYAVHLIGSSLNKAVPAAMLSTSATAPNMPANYDSFRLLGYVRTNGSAQFLVFTILGNGNQRKHYWDALINVLAATTATSFTPLSCATAVAPNAQIMSVQYTLIGTSAGDGFEVRPTGSTSVATLGAVAQVAAVALVGELTTITNASQSIDWITGTGDTLALDVVGFEYFI